MAVSILPKFLTLKWNISRTTWRIEMDDGSFFSILHAPSFEVNFFRLGFPFKHLSVSNSTQKMSILNNVSNLKPSIFHEILQKIFSFFLTIRKIMTCPNQFGSKKWVSFYFTAMFRFWCLHFTNPDKHSQSNLSPILQCSDSGLLLKNTFSNSILTTH